MKVAIVGAGWYGCHIALFLKEKGFEVTVYEANSEIFNELSGNFGVRLHVGLHYPRSSKTRESCIKGYDEFVATYPRLVNKHESSIYGIGVLDAEGKPSKISAQNFNSLSAEHPSFKVINPKDFGYQNLETAIDTKEASVVVGKKLRSEFIKYLEEAGIPVRLKTRVTAVKKIDVGSDYKMLVSTETNPPEEFDYVVNATSYHSFTPGSREPLFDMEITYQVCIGLIYEDTLEKEKGKPTPFIVMDGWFPSLMSYDDGEEKENSHYLLCHGKWAVLDSCPTSDSAKKLLHERLEDKGLELEIEKKSREHLTSFYPEFSDRFKYIGWKGNVLAKTKTEKEFRLSFVFQDEESGIINIFPGKINNIFEAGKEVLTLFRKDTIPENIISERGYRYSADGVLSYGKSEISEKPKDQSRNTSFLQTAESVKILARHNSPSFLSPRPNPAPLVQERKDELKAH